VVLGLGLATLVPQHGNAAMVVTPNHGVKLSGIIVDAGPVNSPVLLSVGLPGLGGSAADPDLIQDVFFRIGGAETTPVSATVSLGLPGPRYPGVQFHDVFTQFLNGSGSINLVINGTGAVVNSTSHGPSDVVSYP